MSRCVCIILFNLIFVPVFSQSEKSLNILSSGYSPDQIGKIILSKENWHPFPKPGDKEGWAVIPKELREAYIKKAEENLNYEWPQLTAVQILDYKRTGSRQKHDAPSGERRNMLKLFVLAECFENEGRFMDDIVNGIWAICEQSFWGIPAHFYLQKDQSGLPDVQEPVVDLVVGETANLLACTVYLLKDKLDSISPLIAERVYIEAKRRVLDPCFERDDFWWMGFKGGIINNWNPWVNSNWMIVNLLLERDNNRRIQALYKSMRSVDNYLNNFPEDGGCDEGPGYWSHAGGKLFSFLELLESVSDGNLTVFNEPLIQEMGKYIYKVYIDYPYFVNYADASAKSFPDPMLIYRYGSKIESDDMISFASFLFGKNPELEKEVHLGGTMHSSIFSMLSLGKIKEVVPKEPLFLDMWFPDLQVMCARSKKELNTGFYLSAKGGHNNESHNHNDVGNFIVYYNGIPCIIDIGVETYTAKTFNEHRYEIWTMQSVYHNLPVINGIAQKEGEAFKAENVKYKANNSQVNFSLDIAKAYPEEAKVETWKRDIAFLRAKEITITETFKLKEAVENNKLNFMTALDAKVLKPGIIELENKGENSFTLYINYPKDKFNVEIELIEVTDEKLKSVWGRSLTQIVMEDKQLGLEGDYKIEIKDK